MRYYLLILFIISQIIAVGQARPTPGVSVVVPTIAQVGAARLPHNITKVKAPFAMPDFKKPVFPALWLSITDKGAKQNIKSTKAIQAAIDEVSSKGGGTVSVPVGIWQTGRISLKSNVNLHLDDGAELHFSGDAEDYLPVVFTRTEGVEVMSFGALIYANGQENIALSGNGKLVGPAAGGSITRGTGNSDSIPVQTPVSQRVYDGQNGSATFLPMFISPINCKKVYIEGISLSNTPFWNIVPVYCDGVIIRGVTVNSVGIPRGDGIDIESSRNVLIEYCTLNCGDDCFTIKAGRGEDGLRVNKPSENIVVRFCLAQQGHGGITCGSETAAMIRNLYVHDCVFNQTDVGVRFKTRRPRGGGGEDLTYERIRMNLRKEAFHFDMLGSARYVAGEAVRLPARTVGRLTPKYRNVVARDIIVENARMFVNIQGIPESPVINFLVENADVKSQKIFAAADARDITIRNAVITSAESVITSLDSRNILFDNVKFNTPDGKVVKQVTGDLPDGFRFLKCSPGKVENLSETRK